MVTASEILERLRGPDRRALPRLATLIENGDPRGVAALDALYPLTGAAHRVGVTGPPGAGKSTLLSALVAHVRESGRQVAVIAVDPSSPVSGGAVLGDRIRMMDRHADEGVFVRSMASRGRQGGLAWATAELTHLLDAAGFPLILIETIGTGQDGTDIAALADTVVVVETPGLGDGVQAIKSGLLEVGDVVVVNKADQPGADEAVRVLRSTLSLIPDPTARRVPVLKTNAISGDGVDALLAAVDRHHAWLHDSGELMARRQRAMRAEVLAGLRAEIDRRFDLTPDNASDLSAIIAQVTRRDLTPRRAIERLAARLTTPGST
jgi:LAO/AO transport system kinase